MNYFLIFSNKTIYSSHSYWKKNIFFNTILKEIMIKNIPKIMLIVLVSNTLKDKFFVISFVYLSSFYQNWRLFSHLLHHSSTNAIKDRKSTRLNSSHVSISYAVFCLKKKKYSTD